MVYGNIRLSAVQHLLERAVELELSADAVQRLKWFVFALEHGNNMSLTCRHFGIARSTYLRWAQRFDPRDPDTLEERSRRPHAMRKPETDAAVVELIRALRVAHPLMSKQEIGARLAAGHGLTISTSTIGRVIARHGFFFADTPSHRQKRLRAGIDEPSFDDAPVHVEKPAADASPASFRPATDSPISA